MKAILVLEDGSVFEGNASGVSGEKSGEVILNTAVVGYQEIMTDPANAGRIVVMTYPLIGNYGVAKKFYESAGCWLSGLVIKEASRIYSNWQAEGSFGDFLKKEKVVALSDADTRTLAVHIRDKGEMAAILSTKGTPKEELLEQLRLYKKKGRKNLIKEISVKEPVEIKSHPGGPRIGVLDLGMANSFIAQLKTLGCDLTLLPYDTSAEKILSSKLNGLIISNGPENDSAEGLVADTVKNILGKLPVMGISTGHEIIGLALGATLKKMKLGHHGVNYPIKSRDALKGEITTQNHSFVIDGDSIKKRKDVTVTLRNINDNTIEALESKNLKFISTQYYPSSPGFDEVNGAFIRFRNMAGRGKTAREISPSQNNCEVDYAKA